MKTLSLDIEHCNKCPYCRYNGNSGFGMNDQRHYYCAKINKIIIYEDAVGDEENFNIPEWCQLSDKPTEGVTK